MNRQELIDRLQSADSNLSALVREAEFAFHPDDLESVLGDVALVAESLSAVVAEFFGGAA